MGCGWRRSSDGGIDGIAGRRIDEVRQLHCASIAMAIRLGFLGRLGWLVLPTFGLRTFNKFV
jgi:hypothetical protein